MALQYTKEQSTTIKNAYEALAHLCSRTNWTDAGEFKTALRLERRASGDLLSARAMVLKGWLEGYQDPNMPISSLYPLREGYRDAVLLGARHKVERAGTEYNGDLCKELESLAFQVTDIIEQARMATVKG